jgi:hypothetical protein
VAALSMSRIWRAGFGAMLEGYMLEGGGAYASHDASVLMAVSYAPTRGSCSTSAATSRCTATRGWVTLFAGVTFVPYYQAAAPARRRAGDAGGGHRQSLVTERMRSVLSTFASLV